MLVISSKFSDKTLNTPNSNKFPKKIIFVWYMSLQQLINSENNENASFFINIFLSFICLHNKSIYFSSSTKNCIISLLFSWIIKLIVFKVLLSIVRGNTVSLK